MPRLLQLLALFAGLVLPASAATCSLFPASQPSIQLSPYANRICLQIHVDPGTALQILVPQPLDLALSLQHAGSKLLLDGFDFGQESATLTESGDYTLEITAVKAVSFSHDLVMSRRPLPLPLSFLWKNAEILAAHAKFTRTQAAINDALAAWRELGDTLSIARTTLLLGDAFLKAATYTEARDAYASALALCRTIPDTRCAAEAANNTALAAQNLGDFELSSARLLEAANAWKLLGDPLSEGITISNLGLQYWLINDFQTAINYDTRAAAILRPLDPLAHARVLNNLGLCYQSLGEYPAAQRYFTQAVALTTRLPDAAHASLRFRLNLGRNTMLMGRLAESVRLLEAVQGAAGKLADRPALADTLNNLGQAHLRLASTEKAADALTDALRLHRVLGDRRLVASDLHYLGEVAAARSRYSEARRMFTEAVSIRQECSLRDAAADSLYSLALVDKTEAKSTDATSLLEQALGITETVRASVPGPALRAAFMARKRRFTDLNVELALSREPARAPSESLLAADRGVSRALLDLLAGDKLSSTAPPELTARRTSLEHRLDMISSRLSVAPADRIPALRSQAADLVATLEQTESEIRAANPSQRLYQPLASLDLVFPALSSLGAAMLQYHLSSPQSYLWLVLNGRVQVFILPSASVIERDARRLNALLPELNARRRDPALQHEFENILHRFSLALLSPLRDIPVPAQIILVPDGILSRVPFEALTIPGSPRPLGLLHRVARIPSASYLLAGKPPRAEASFPKTFLGLTDPVFPDLPRLPFSSDLDIIAARIPPSRRTILRRFDASLAGLTRLPLPDYAFIHLSTHAIIDDQIPELSRIALSSVDPQGKPLNGFLLPYQLSGWKLDGGTVVLSACETALGKPVTGEGFTGFAASLLSAGASRLVLTLAPVDAEGSSEFLRAVYSQHFDHLALSLPDAMMSARQELASSRRWSDPWYWASFVMVGLPAPL